MAQHDYNISNASFPTVRADINNALTAVATNNSGDAAPSTTFANQWWYETDQNKLHFRNEDNDAFIHILTLNQTNDTVTSVEGSATVLAGIDDQSSSNDDQLTISDTAVIINEDSDDLDFRVESNGNANMIFVDGGADHVNIGTATDLGGVLNVEGTLVTNGGAVFNEGSADVDFRIEGNGNANLFVADGGADAVLVGTATHDGNAAFTVNSTSNGSRPCFILNGGAVATTTYGTRFKMSVTRDDNTSDLMVAGDNTADRFQVLSDGDVKNHDNSYGALSDQRIKQNITDASSQWDDIKAIKVRKFKRKDDVRYYAENAWEQIGVIAQELEASSMDKLVNETNPTANDITSSSEFGSLYTSSDAETQGDNPTKQVGDVKTITAQVKGVKYSVLYMKAIKALQEAQLRVEALETRVTALEG